MVGQASGTDLHGCRTGLIIAVEGRLEGGRWTAYGREREQTMED